MNISKSEFKTLLLIYGANVDYVFCKSELKFIEANATSAEEFTKCMNLYAQESEATIFSWITSFLKKKEAFTFEEIEKLTVELESLFICDGLYCNFEKSFMAFFQLLKTKTYLN